MKINTTLENFESNLWGYHLPIDESVASQYITKDDKRVICKINDTITLHCAIMQNKTGHFILMNRQNIAKLQIKTGDSVSIEIEKDKSEYGMPMPESFRYLLADDEAGSSYFHSLTPGKQRSLIYIVSQVKNIDSQLNKGLAILDHLKTSNGQLNFKQLMQLIKEYNQRSKLQ